MLYRGIIDQYTADKEHAAMSVHAVLWYIGLYIILDCHLRVQVQTNIP